MGKIFVTRKLDDKLIDKLSEFHEVDVWESEDQAIPRAELLARVSGVDGILCMLTEKVDEELLDAAGEDLKVVSTMSVGFDHVDFGVLKSRGIALGYTPDVLSDSVADIAISLMLNASRRVTAARQAVLDGGWQTWSPYWMTGYDLSRATVGLVGLGKIATTTAKRLKGFDCDILYYSRTRKPEIEQELGVKYVGLDDLLAKSDFVSIHAPLTPETSLMCSEEMFSKMKNSTVFINTSRGGLVDQDALYRALSTGQIYAAGLDVTTPEPLPVDSPLLGLDNCLVLPHIGSASIRTRDEMGHTAVDNLLAGLSGQPLAYQVN